METKEKLFVMTFSQQGDEVTVRTKFIKKISGPELAVSLKTAIHGLIDMTQKITGFDEVKTADFLFGKKA